jgi:hypothetical protein
MKLTDLKWLPNKKARDAKAETLAKGATLRLQAMHVATGQEYLLYILDPPSRRITADMSPSMKTFHEWIQDGQLVRAAYIKYMFEQSMQQQQAEQLRLEDLSKDLLIITAFRASEGLIRNRKGVLPFERQDRSAEQLESALEEHAPWWPRPHVPYKAPKDMTSEQLHNLIRAMVSRGYEAQQKLLAIIRGSWKEYPKETDTNTVLAVLRRMVQEDWAAGEQHAKSHACML